MDKKSLRQILILIRKVPAIVFLSLAVIFAITAIFSLRANNQKMIELRDAVFVADEQNGDVEGALKALREHVYAHMNTDLSSGENSIHPPLQLKYTYERLAKAEQKKVQSSNAELYDEATKYCEARFPAGQLANGRVQCVARYIDEHSQGKLSVTVPDDLYKFDFVSPAWSPDLAGWSIVLAVLFTILFIARLAGEFILRKATK